MPIGKTPNEVQLAILAASRHDYTTFYEQEIVFRGEAGYPPFTQLLRLVVRNRLR